MTETRTEDKWIRARDVAEILGCSKSWAVRLIADGVLPSFKVGRMRVVKDSVLREWMERQEG